MLITSACSSSTPGPLTIASGAYPAAYAELLQKYVTPTGVRYADWHSNPDDMKKIEEVANFYATTTPPADRNANLAWHLNAYNAWILRNILAKYPTKGPLDGETLFFHGNRIVISGKKTSFNDLEQKMIRPVFKEPRIHFALNCASESCPPLNAQPFDATSLDGDLNRLTRAFINNNPQGVVPAGNEVKLSKIFQWYADDFGGKNALVTFINRYRQNPLPEKIKTEFLDYSWKLNSVK